MVYRYVHNLAACHRIKPGQEHDRADEIAKQCTAIVPSAYPSDAYSINVVRYEGDATNQEAVYKQKIHMALVDRAFLDATSIADGMGTDAFDTYISEHALRTRSLCDIQEVNKGTTEEFRGIMKKQFESVKCKTWLDRVREPVPGLVRVFTTMLDMGPENLGFGPTALQDVAGANYTMVHLMFCMEHQFHLCDEDVLKVLDGWTWTHRDDATTNRYKFGGKHTGLVKTVANTWRSWGLIKNCRMRSLLSTDPMSHGDSSRT